VLAYLVAARNKQYPVMDGWILWWSLANPDPSVAGGMDMKWMINKMATLKNK